MDLSFCSTFSRMNTCQCGRNQVRLNYCENPIRKSIFFDVRIFENFQKMKILSLLFRRDHLWSGTKSADPLTGSAAVHPWARIRHQSRPTDFGFGKVSSLLFYQLGFLFRQGNNACTFFPRHGDFAPITFWSRQACLREDILKPAGEGLRRK